MKKEMHCSGYKQTRNFTFYNKKGEMNLNYGDLTFCCEKYLSNIYLALRCRNCFRKQVKSSHKFSVILNKCGFFFIFVFIVKTHWIINREAAAGVSCCCSDCNYCSGTKGAVL